MRWLVFIVVLTGCNALFDLEPTELLPADLHDGDGDGVADDNDNCPLTPNANQGDEDRDTIGDVCDNCPLISNPEQEVLGDTDPMGDLCDPHPIVAGDCPIIVDSFEDPRSLGVNWTVSTFVPGSVPQVPAPNALVDVVPHGVKVVPGQTGAVVQLIARGLSVDPGQFFDVQVAATAMITKGSVMAGTHLHDDMFNEYGERGGAQAGVTTPQLGATVDYHSGNGYGATTYVLSADVVNNHLLVRFSTTTDDGTSLGRVRIDYGVATSFIMGFPNTPVLTGGGPGAVVVGDPATVEAIAISHFQPGVECPAAVVR
ncbi:MAG TPA: thrombospondin type 3 repeat-containing protein [Kofleriaceae bacterium]|nr:thrombospondin type 3 repeat-containing protein [Kofleriaceae bacterium]